MFLTIILYAAKLVIIAAILTLLIIWLRNEYMRDRFLGIGLSVLAIMLLLYFAFFNIVYKIWVD